jgi:Htaa protein
MKSLGIAFTLVALAAASSPGAAASTGTTTIELKGKAAKSLRTQGVRIGTFGGAKRRRARLVLPVAGGLVSSTALLNQNGGVRLSRRADGRRRSVELRRLQVRLGRSSRIIGRIGDRRFTLFAVKAPAARLSLDSRTGAASLRGGTLSVTRRAAVAVKRRLRLRRLPRGAFGRLTVDALVGGSAGGGPGSGSGGPGGGPPASGPIGDEPPVLARPATAVNVTGAQITWHVKPSWIRYINTGEGTTPFGGASGDPADATPECGDGAEPPVPLVYAFHFPFANGWYDPPTKTAGVYFGGGVNFSYRMHGIDLDTKEPEVEINGASSRAIFRFDGRQSTRPGNKRAVLVDLDTAASPPVEGPGTVSYDRIPGTIPADGGSASVFAGFYAPGERFGCVSISFTHAGGP